MPVSGKIIIQDGIVYESFVKNVAVVGYDSTCHPMPAITIPAMIDGKPVTEVQKSAFEGLCSLINVTLPESCRKIHLNAFKDCLGLVSVSVPGIPKMGQFYVEQQAFANCKSLKVLDVGEAYIWLEKEAFMGCVSLEIVAGKLFEVEERAFHNCPNLLGLIVASHGHLSAKTFGNSQPRMLSIEGKLTRPSRTLFRGLKDTKILCTDQFPYWDLVYEGYHIQAQ